MYAIVFDCDRDVLGQIYPSASSNNAYADLKAYLAARGFEWKQGSA